MRCAIIGAGMAGLACADALHRAGHAVELFDKGRAPGGRMSTRRLPTALGDAAFDYGAQYFTARDPGFCRLVAMWRECGVAEPWPVVADDAWVGRPGMNAVIRHMAAAYAVTWNQPITGMVRADRLWRLLAGNQGAGQAGATGIGPFDAVVLAIPAEQAAAMLSLHDFAMARIALIARSRPCWTSMFVFDRRLDELPALIRTGGDIAWAARNSAKPRRSGPEAWVVQASASWSEARIEWSPGDIAAPLHAGLAQTAGCVLPKPVAALSHRWRYALSAGTGEGALWQPALRLGVCGDWLLGPRVECAWLSGRLLAERMIAER